MRYRISLFILLATLFVFPQGVLCQEYHRKPRVYELAQDFSSIWTRIEKLSAQEKVAYIKKDYFSKFPTFYEYKTNKWLGNGEEPDVKIENTLRDFSSIKERYDKKAHDIANNLDLAIESFVKYFSDLNRDFDVYVVHSFGEMDGGTRIIDGQFYFRS